MTSTRSILVNILAFYCVLKFYYLNGNGSLVLAASTISPTTVTLLDTPTTRYLLSKHAEDQETAKQICQAKNGQLVSIDDREEDMLISAKLSELGIGSVWTGGIKFSNNTVDSLYLRSTNYKTLAYTNFHKGESKPPQKRSARNRRDIQDSKNCDCDCPSPGLPFEPCKPPSCTIIIPDPPCQQVHPQNCIITRHPQCSARPKKCNVDCGPECTIVRQPKCYVKPSSKPRCRLEQDMSKCEVKKSTCTIVEPGTCRSEQGPCEQDNTDTCKPIQKPCKNGCKELCTSVQPPCITTPSVCTTTECSSSNSSKCRSRRSCSEQAVSCPPPRTECRRPFVDCSPEICQSSVLICPPPKIKCPPPTIICSPPKVSCEHAEPVCPEPEVICEEPDIECSKPLVKCPDAKVNCDPIITTCEPPAFTCSEAVMDCKHPDITCGDPQVCTTTPAPPPESTPTPCPCNCGSDDDDSKDDRNRSKRHDMLSPEAEFVPTTECIAMRKEMDFKWEAQSCYQKHRFICEKAKKEKRGVLDWLSN